MSDIQAVANKPKSVVLEAKEFLKNYDGPVAYKQMKICCQIMRRVYKRDAQLIQRNALYITFYSRLSFDAVVIDPVEKSIFAAIKKLEDKINKYIAQNEVLIVSEGIEKLADATVIEDITVPVTSPMFGAFIKLMGRAEVLSNQYNTLWLEGIINGKDHQAKRYELALDFKKITSLLRNNWLKLLKILPEAKEERLKRVTQREEKAKSRKERAPVINVMPTSETTAVDEMEEDQSHTGDDASLSLVKSLESVSVEEPVSA